MPNPDLVPSEGAQHPGTPGQFEFACDHALEPLTLENMG